MPAPIRIALRPMLPDDGSELAAIFAASIDELTESDYSPDQQAAWIAAGGSETSFGGRLQGFLTILAVVDGEIAGFASLKGLDVLEMLYVRPEAARQGVATALCDALEKMAQARGATALTAAASDTAQPFLAKRGYEALHRETIMLGEEWLGRTLMRKALSTGADHTRH